jgi:peroxiredoxin (alkyl hydroperoxide reductase subunit C)
LPLHAFYRAAATIICGGNVFLARPHWRARVSPKIKKQRGFIMAVLVGKKAPDFTATAVLGNNDIKDITLSEFTKGKYTVLFFYPLDFTFVCPSELIAFDHRLQDFKSRNVEVVGVSIDSQFTHLAWKNTPVDKGGIGQVGYALVADIKHEIAKAYDVEAEGGVAFRGSFLIDKSGVVQHQVVNNLPLGRDIDEMLRMVDALQFTEENGEVCPAGWKKGKKGMTASTEGVAAYLAENATQL